MEGLRSWLRRALAPRADVDGGAWGDADAVARAQLEMASALTLAYDTLDAELELAGHAARVAALADELAARLGLDEGARRTLAAAALLHEVGMIAVPRALLRKRGALTPAQLDAVRAQAVVGAELVRATHGELVADLVEHQYADMDALVRAFPGDGPALVLAGILRLADVLDAVTRPRPYQPPLPPALRDDLLASGSGTRFHPAAVHAFLKLPRAA
ncbi:MAG TPA: HD domain-containing phosphohydrolase [Longimicrobium sp.]|nr:HD domain-containing phosphohydrolase [Longimicrobium sp.]